MSVRLVEDSSLEAVPAPLEHLARALCDAALPIESLHKDLFMAVLVVLMLENGFSPLVVQDDYYDDSSLLLRLPTDWKRIDGSYETKFVLKQFPTLTINLVVIPLGSTMLVNAVLVDMNNDVYSECVPLSLYVVAPMASTVPRKYRNLKALADILKTKIVSPVRSRILRYHGFESASLIGLSRDVLHEIFMYLSIKDILNVSQACLDMLWVKNDNNLWHALLKRDYPKAEAQGEPDYLQLYKKERERICELSRKQSSKEALARRAGHMHRYMDHSVFVSNIKDYYNYE